MALRSNRPFQGIFNFWPWNKLISEIRQHSLKERVAVGKDAKIYRDLLKTNEDMLHKVAQFYRSLYGAEQDLANRPPPLTKRL